MSLLLLLQNGTPEPEVVANRLRVVERPPMRQCVIATSPNGAVRRWAEDEPDAADVLEDLTDSDTAPGGNKDLTGALPRKPGVDYSDMHMGTRLEVLGAGGYEVSEYRLERAPRTSGDYLVMDPAASGYQVLLSDKEEARAIFLDSDMTAWGEPSAEKRITYPSAQYNQNGQVSLAPAGGTGSTPTPPALVHAWAHINTHGGANPDVAESEYDGSGVELGEVLLDGVAGTGIVPGWLMEVWANAEPATYGELLGNFNGTTASDVRVSVGFGHTMLSIQTQLPGSVDLEGKFEALYRNIKVRDRSGLPLYGSWPEVGILASDVISYALSRWAPGIRFTTGPYGSIQASRFLIPHLVFKEPTTVLEMITQALRFELLEWGVWPGRSGPTFYLNERGQREGAKRWRTRIRPAKLTETGEQMDQIYNRVVMSWQDPDGTTRAMGPIGSGYPYTDSRCEDLDPESPLNEAGVVRTKHLTMNGMGTATGAAEQARLFLEKCRLLNSSGEATLTGYVEDDRGVEWPYYCVHAGDQIEFLDASISGPRYIIEATRSRKTRSVGIKLDSRPDSYESILAELQVRETAGVAT